MAHPHRPVGGRQLSSSVGKAISRRRFRLGRNTNRCKLNEPKNKQTNKQKNQQQRSIRRFDPKWRGCRRRMSEHPQTPPSIPGVPSPDGDNNQSDGTTSIYGQNNTSKKEKETHWDGKRERERENMSFQQKNHIDSHWSGGAPMGAEAKYESISNGIEPVGCAASTTTKNWDRTYEEPPSERSPPLTLKRVLQSDARARVELSNRGCAGGKLDLIHWWGWAGSKSGALHKGDDDDKFECVREPRLKGAMRSAQHQQQRRRRRTMRTRQPPGHTGTRSRYGYVIGSLGLKMMIWSHFGLFLFP